jgi:hypothetical protein
VLDPAAATQLRLDPAASASPAPPGVVDGEVVDESLVFIEDAVDSDVEEDIA